MNRYTNLIKDRIRARKKSELIVFSIIILFLLAKSFLITEITSDTSKFLDAYMYLSNDSYDWVANGIRLFQNDGISYRNPGLVLIIKLFNNMGLIYLLPLMGNTAFFITILYLYKIMRRIVSLNISLILALAAALNFSFNASANLILADIYAVSFITMSLYYLISRKYFIAFFTLGISILFQNIGFFLLIMWLIYYLLSNKELARRWRNKDFFYLVGRCLALLATCLPFVAWGVYKYIEFGNPLFTRVEQFSLLHLHFDSLTYYGFNLVSMFGLVLFLVLYYAFTKARMILSNKTLLFCIACLLFNIVFWVLLYDWDDRRFLLYFLPFLMPLIAYSFQLARNKSLYLLIFFVVSLYPTTLPLTTLFSGRELPIVHNIYLNIVRRNESSIGATINKRPGYDNPLMNLSPSLYGALINFGYEATSQSTYRYYANYINNNFDPVNKRLCIESRLALRTYLVKSILMIDKNIDLAEVTVQYDCEKII